MISSAQKCRMALVMMTFLFVVPIGCKKKDVQSDDPSVGFSGSPYNGLWTAGATGFGTIYYYLTDIGSGDHGVVAEKTGRFEKLRVKPMRYGGKNVSSIMFYFDVDGMRTENHFELKGDTLELTSTTTGLPSRDKPLILHRVSRDQARSIISEINQRRQSTSNIHQEQDSKFDSHSGFAKDKSVYSDRDLVFNEDISALSNSQGGTFILYPSLGRYEFDNVTLWDRDGLIIFRENFDNLSHWRIISGNWSCLGGVCVYDDNKVAGKLMANNIELKDSYVLEYDVRVTRHNPNYSYVDHLRVWLHYTLSENRGYNCGLRQNGMSNWFCSAPDDFRTSHYKTDDTQWIRLRLEKKGTILKLFSSVRKP